MAWLLIIASVAGIVGIFVVRLKETQRMERLRVKLEKRVPGNLAVNEQADNAPRKILDIRAINDAFNKADLLYAKGRVEEAHKAFIQVLALNPDHVDANNKLGLIYLHTNMPAKAETIFRKLIDGAPRNAIYYGNLGLALFNQNHLQEAIEAYETAILLDPKKESRYLSLARLFIETGKIKEAIGAYSKALELNPKNAELYFVICDLLIKIKGYAEAMATMKALEEVQPYNRETHDKIREIKILMGVSPLGRTR